MCLWFAVAELTILPAQSAQRNETGALMKHLQKQQELRFQSRAPARLVEGASAQ